MAKRSTRSHRPTKHEKLLQVLSDGKFHSTKDLARRVGHRFGGAKFMLMKYGYFIEKRPHARRRWQWEYRLRS